MASEGIDPELTWGSNALIDGNFKSVTETCTTGTSYCTHDRQKNNKEMAIHLDESKTIVSIFVANSYDTFDDSRFTQGIHESHIWVGDVYPSEYLKKCSGSIYDSGFHVLEPECTGSHIVIIRDT